jgi:hypothetical protein
MKSKRAWRSKIYLESMVSVKPAFTKWRAKFCYMKASEARQLEALAGDYGKLERLPAEAHLDI